MAQTIPTTCPHCAADLVTPGDLESDDGLTLQASTFSRVVGVEQPGIYDGVLYWRCPDCHGIWHRWPEGHYLHDRAKLFVDSVR